MKNAGGANKQDRFTAGAARLWRNSRFGTVRARRTLIGQRRPICRTCPDIRSTQPDLLPRDRRMSVNSDHTLFRQARLMAASAIAPAIRLRIYGFALACRRSRLFWRKWEVWAWPLLTSPLIWTLIALIVSSAGLYWDLR